MGIAKSWVGALTGGQPHLAHQPRHPAAPLPAQLAMDPWRALDPASDSEDAPDVSAHRGVNLGVVLNGGDRMQPSVGAADAGAEHPAQRRHGMVAPLGRRTRTSSRDPLGEHRRGLAQDQFLLLEPPHLSAQPQHLGLLGHARRQGLGRACRQLLRA